MLRVHMRVRSRCRLERHGAEGTFIEDLTVSVLDVGFYSCNISEDHTTVDTARGRGNRSLQKSDLHNILNKIYKYETWRNMHRNIHTGIQTYIHTYMYSCIAGFNFLQKVY